MICIQYKKMKTKLRNQCSYHVFTLYNRYKSHIAHPLCVINEQAYYSLTRMIFLSTLLYKSAVVILKLLKRLDNCML